MSLLFWLLAACAESVDPLQSWIGRDATVLKQVWGNPTEETVSLDGVAMIYVSYWRNGVQNNTHRCQRTFVVNAKGIITGHAASDC